MKRLVVICMLAALIGGCRRSGTPAPAYRNWSDQLAVAVGLRDLGLVSPCTIKKKTANGESYEDIIPLDQCFRMAPQRHWTGLWRDEFEGSRFCPAPATECKFNTPGDVIWLEVERVTSRRPDGALYAIEFIGRRTAVKGHYGHMGGSDYEIIVDRFISVKQVGPPLPPQTEAQIDAEVNSCIKAKQCSSWNR